MMDSDESPTLLDESDLALVDALQVNPRGSWTSLAAALESSPVTLARRWQRLVHDGAAWVSVGTSNATTHGAIVELACRPGTEAEVASGIAQLPYAGSVGITTGEYQVFANLVAPTLAATSSILIDRLPLPVHVERTRSHVFGGLFGAMTWRLGVMNVAQSRQLREAIGPPRVPSRAFDRTDRALFLALCHDGRRSFTGLAEDLDTTPQAVRRRLKRLQQNGDIVFRCDVARALAGWHSAAMLWLTVPDVDLRTVGRQLGQWPETRLCAAVASTANLALIVNLHSFDHLEELLVRVATQFPGTRVTERRLVLRMVKVYGRLVDETGRSTRVIPPDPWAGAEDLAGVRRMLPP